MASKNTSKGHATASQDACRWVGYRVADNHTFHQSNSSGRDVMGDSPLEILLGFCFAHLREKLPDRLVLVLVLVQQLL